jgi:aldose 1-epimerase
MVQLLKLANERLSLRVSEQGGAVVDGHTSDGLPFLRPYRGAEDAFDVLQCACFPLVPLGNRVEGNGFDMGGRRYRFEPNTEEPFYIHGDGWLGRWKVEEKSGAGITLSFVQEQPGQSPHVYRAMQSITLDGATLRMELSVQNCGTEALPFGIGFHPYFPRSAGTKLSAPASLWWTEGADYLPKVREPVPETADFSRLRELPVHRLNHCFEGWTSMAKIVWPETGLGARIAADPIFSRYMLYAPDEDPTFFCLEPMSHAPNALAMAGPEGLHVLAPGETLSGGFSISVFNHGEAQ